MQTRQILNINVPLRGKYRPRLGKLEADDKAITRYKPNTVSGRFRRFLRFGAHSRSRRAASLTKTEQEKATRRGRRDITHSGEWN